MPADGLPEVFERGSVEIEVLCLSDILRLTTDAYISEASGSQTTELTESRLVAEGWREPTHRQ